jgi:methylenetetrahydrofolate dehydrogenase (NADP+)/methenyltetrahydrofolate cyclohydrolase
MSAMADARHRLRWSSSVYVRNKRTAAERAGIRAHDYDLPARIPARELFDLIDRLNADPDIDGILVQLPMPEHIDPAELIQRIAPEKDVDGFHAQNMGKLVLRQPGLRPCTPQGVIHLLRHAGAGFYGQHAVVVGASNHVGRPMVLELLLAGATVTCCHRFTRGLERHVAEAELLVVAVGKPGVVRGEWVRPGAVVIDVGINRLADGSLCGDVAFQSAAARASWITPVPGGVGPMTVAMLMQNTLKAAQLADSL